MKKIIFLSLIIAEITVISACSDIVGNHPSDIKGTVSAEQLMGEKQRKAEKVGNAIISSLAVTKGDRNLYPDYFGGIYINKNKEVVVLIKGSPELYANVFRTNSDVDVQLVECEYSLNELNETIEYMAKKLRSNEGLATSLGIDAFGIRTSENRIKVQLQNCGQTSIDLFKEKVLDSPMLDFIPTQGPYEFLSTTIQMGEKFHLVV